MEFEKILVLWGFESVFLGVDRVTAGVSVCQQLPGGDKGANRVRFAPGTIGNQPYIFDLDTTYPLSGPADNKTMDSIGKR